MNLRRGLRQCLFVVAITLLASEGGDLAARWLFGDDDEPDDDPVPPPPPPAATTAAIPAAAELTPPPPPPPPAPKTKSDDPHCPAFAIATTGVRPELKQLLEELVVGAGVPGHRVHLFVDHTANVVDHQLLATLQQRYDPHIHHRSAQQQKAQEQQRPARPWPAEADSTGEGMSKSVRLWYHYSFMLETMFGAPSAPPPFGDYVAILEDDLSVAPDIDGYFCRMSRVMATDSAVVTVSTHNDAGFWPMASDVRAVIRHEHFAQPGWMTSRAMYTQHIRSRWLGPVRGHWDLAMQYLVYGQGSPVPADADTAAGQKNRPPLGTLHTLAPEVPRTFHRSSSDALTVGKQGMGSQLLDFANIRLNSERVDWSRVSTAHLASGLAYDRHIEEHLESATFLDCLRGGGAEFAGRGVKLAAVVPCRSDDDRRCWDQVMADNFHLYGVGLGDVPRGVYKGTVFVRWLTNRLLLVAMYSPFVNSGKAAAWLQQPSPLSGAARGSTLTLSKDCLRHVPQLASPPDGMSVVVGKGGQGCDQACGQMRKVCSAALMPLVNPREPGQAVFCGAAWHPFLLEALAPHLPRTAAAKLSAAGGGAPVPCKISEVLGYPALLHGDKAGKRLWATSHRLLNCTARPADAAATRVCACVGR